MAAFQEPSKLIITGVPRYDAIFHMAGRSGKRHGGRKNILFCSELLRETSFEDICLFAKPLPFYKTDFDRYLYDVLDAAKNIQEVHVQIKPHYNNEHLWGESLQKYGIHSDRWTLLSHSADIFQLMVDADLVISPESSVIVEAIMFRKPVIILNYGGIRYKTPSYESSGVVAEATDREGLNDNMKKLLFDEQYLEQLSRKREAVFKQFSEFWDGCNTDRVVAKILDGMTRSISC
jgi:CDP-glycerol glycerophosphotransferase (TagB/SpsB family)